MNQSKSDHDPAEWLPTYDVCTYVAQWTAVKTRWRLSTDRAEKSTLTHLARHCSNRWLTVARAPITRGGSNTDSNPGRGHTGGAASTRRFSYCYEAIAHGYGPYYRGRDPEYAWYTDADSDGIVCE